jgi:hypothetical protein
VTDAERDARSAPAAVYVLLAAVAYGAAARGAFPAAAKRLFLAAVGVAALVAWREARHAPRWWTPFALVAPLGAWSVVTAAAAGDVSGALPVLGILFGVAAAALVGELAGDGRGVLVDGLLLIGAVAGLIGWVGVVWRVHTIAAVETGVWRAASTLTYENATAALLAPLAAVAIARAAARPERASDRLVAATLVIGVGATQSRAGFAGLAAGLLVVALCVPLPRLVPVAVPVLVGAGIAVAGVVAVSPVDAHRGPLPALVAVGIGLAVAAAQLRWNRRTTVWVAVGVAVVGLVGVSAVVGRGAGAVRTSRLSLDSQDRANEWQATARVARHHLFTGVGPTHLVVRWVDTHGQVTEAHFTHNEYLQLAAEEGVVAAALVIAGIGVVAWALGRRVASSGRGDWLAAGALGGLAAFAVHSSFDFIWHVPVVPVVVAALVGAANGRRLDSPVPTGARSSMD